MIDAELIKDSVSRAGIRITTFELTYPRFIHAEFMTHRVFSRNASSSRAIPVATMLKMIRTYPAMPVFWGKNQSGMQAREELTGWSLWWAKFWWITAMHFALFAAENLVALKLHKQIANRILEPWGHIKVVVTSTNWSNFLALRNHPDAQPEIKVLAELVSVLLATETPKKLKEGEWHLPYVNDYEVAAHGIDDAVCLSVARCARVSYKTHDGGIPDPVKDLELYLRLVGSKPLHASPAEHQATPDRKSSPGSGRWRCKREHGNFTGWRQLRKTLENEYVREPWEL